MARLLKTQEEIASRLAKGMIGKQCRVLVEGHSRQPGTLAGRLDNNLVVEFAGDAALIGSYATVNIEDARVTMLKGSLQA